MSLPAASRGKARCSDTSRGTLESGMCWPVPAVVAALTPDRHRGRSRDHPASLIVHEGNSRQGGDVFECSEINVASDSPLVMRPAIIEIRSPAAPTGVEKFAGGA